MSTIPPFADWTRPFPDGQIRVSFPPGKADFSTRRREPGEPIAESYLSNVVRIPTDTGPVDLTPSSDRVSVAPSEVYGPACHTVWFVSSSHGFSRAMTQPEQHLHQQRFTELLDLQGWSWRPATCFPTGRQWIELGAVLLQTPESDWGPDEVLFLAHQFGQDAVIRWDAEGFTALPTPSVATPEAHSHTVPVSAELAAGGCPLVGGRDEWCKREGGPWTSGSITAAAVWQQHRRMLVDALGCGVCGGGPHSPGRAVLARELFLPSRQGGWQWGVPLSRDEVN